MITSRQNQVIKQFRAPPKTVFVVEGEKLIAEAIAAKFVLMHCLFTEKYAGKFHGEVITAELSEYICDTKSPQGVFAMFERKQASFESQNAHRIMILDSIQDPGNVGAIIRSCEAFGFDCVMLSNDCADVFNSKVIRASAGSVFRLPCIYAKLPELNLKDFTVYGAALDKDAISLKQAKFSGKAAIVIGNEGRGISDEVLALCDHKLYIPIKGAESLNASVAAGIICYEIGSRA